MTLTHPITKVCKCCGEWWLPLPGDTSAICIRCDRLHLEEEREHDQARDCDLGD